MQAVAARRSPSIMFYDPSASGQAQGQTFDQIDSARRGKLTDPVTLLATRAPGPLP
jgi:hypothetical protein